MVTASQVRVRTFDPFCSSRHFLEDLRALRRALSAPDRPYAKAVWGDWYSRSFALTVDRARERFVQEVCSVDTLWQEFQTRSSQPGHLANGATCAGLLARAEARPQPRPGCTRTFRAQFQLLVYRRLMQRHVPDPTALVARTSTTTVTS